MPRVADLTEQQKKCLRLVHQGRTSKEIAPLLETTPGVVDNYVNAAMAKLNVTSRRDAARALAAEEEGMVQRLHLQSEPIATSSLVGRSGSSTEGPATPLPSLLGLPPIGGRTNDLRTLQRLAAILRICFLAALVLAATVTVIQGAITLLT